MLAQHHEPMYYSRYRYLLKLLAALFHHATIDQRNQTRLFYACEMVAMVHSFGRVELTNLMIFSGKNIGQSDFIIIICLPMILYR